MMKRFCKNTYQSFDKSHELFLQKISIIWWWVFDRVLNTLLFLELTHFTEITFPFSVIQLLYRDIDSLHTTGLFLYPPAWKHQKPLDFLIFQGEKKEISDIKWVNGIWLYILFGRADHIFEVSALSLTQDRGLGFILSCSMVRVLCKF